MRMKTIAHGQISLFCRKKSASRRKIYNLSTQISINNPCARIITWAIKQVHDWRIHFVSFIGMIICWSCQSLRLLLKSFPQVVGAFELLHDGKALYQVPSIHLLLLFACWTLIRKKKEKNKKYKTISILECHTQLGKNSVRHLVRFFFLFYTKSILISSSYK